MNATGLSAQVTVPPAAESVSAAAVPVAAQEDSGSDFVAMLMQLIGGSAPNAVTSPAVKLPATDAVSDDSDDAEALAAMLALQMPVMPAALPWAAQPTATSDTGVDPLELLGLGAAATKDGAGSLLALQVELTDDVPDVPDISGDTSEGVGSLSPFKETLHTRTVQAEAAATRTLHSPVGTERWAEELGARMTWMAEGGQQSASLRLSPEHLGPLEVRISITDDKASVWFGAAHADTRAAIETALPRLREMFIAQGLSLSDAGVFREPPRDQPPAPPRTFGNGSSTETSRQEGEVRISTRGIGLFDAYA
jgi:flagellar hook-length control protein FliK